MKNIKLKICGMKHNTAQVAALQPDYLGFIFYDKSPRNFEVDISEEFNDIKKVGVFVNASIQDIIEAIKNHHLDAIQLHGDESPAFCKDLKARQPIELWKVFSIKDTFDFSILKDFEDKVDKFLFDTKGTTKGGNGYTFDWSVLNNYPSQKPFILSGGIGLDEVEKVKEILKTGLPIYAIDVNSKFESDPGIKNIKSLKDLVSQLKEY
jgi:phosphoribosylanthranilate isomerase